MPYESGVLKPWVGKTWTSRGDVGQRSTAPHEAFGPLVPDTLLRPQPKGSASRQRLFSPLMTFWVFSLNLKCFRPTLPAATRCVKSKPWWSGGLSRFPPRTGNRSQAGSTGWLRHWPIQACGAMQPPVRASAAASLGRSISLPPLSVIAFTLLSSFSSLLLALLGKFAVGERKCYLHFREDKILSRAPGQN